MTDGAEKGVTNEVENEGKHAVVLSSMHFWGGLISVYFFVLFFVDPKSSSHELHCVHLRMVDNGSALVAVGRHRSRSFAVYMSLL